MLRQEQQLKPYRKVKDFEDMSLYNPEEELIPLPHALAWALIVHALFCTVPVFVLLLNPTAFMARPPQIKYRDMEFVLVNQPEKEPINKNTPLRAEQNSQAGGIHDPNKPISPPEAALPKSAPSQMGNDKKQKAQEEPAPKKIAQSQPQQPVVKKEPKKEEPPKQVTKPAPKPPKVVTRPSLPASKSPNTMKLPIPPSSDAPKIAAPTGPVTSNPSGNYKGSSSSAQPKPVIASGGASGHGSGNKAPSSTGSGRGSSYSPGGGNVGNPGPGNPHGAPGVDAIKEPNFGPYMSDLQRRIKANWDPPRGDESKRVVLLFRIAKDGRLLSVKVVKSSGSQAADRAALAAVELTAPFRALPSDYRGTDVDIQFTFDYNVFGVKRY